MTKRLETTNSITVPRFNLHDDETIGRVPFGTYLSSLLERHKLLDAFRCVAVVKNPLLKEQSLRLLSDIEDCLNILYPYNTETPSLSATVSDNSITLEWIFNNRRAGFCIEEDDSESSWYFITTKDRGNITADGLIKGVNMQKIIIQLLIGLQS